MSIALSSSTSALDGARHATESCAVSPAFQELLCRDGPLDGNDEMVWLEQALGGRTVAAAWTGRQGLVAPVSYQRHAELDTVCQAFAARGWPVRLRRSGGGVVPQGPGILNLSLAYPCAGQAGDLSQAVYQHLCAILASSLLALGIATVERSVPGSFCDGRYNLAVELGGVAHKICGTAQYWKRADGAQAVLVHALVLLDARVVQMTEICNAFESALGSSRRYETDTLTNVMQTWKAAHPNLQAPDDFGESLKQEIAIALGHVARKNISVNAL